MKETALNYGEHANGQSVANEPLTTHQFPDPMEREALIKAVSEAFKANPSVEKFHVTKDAQCFLREHDARQHERFLGVHHRGVEVITRESVDRVLSGEAAKPDKEQRVVDDGGAGKGEQGVSGNTDAASSDTSSGAASGDDQDDAVAKAKKALADDVAERKAAAKAPAPKKAAAKKTTKKK